jgi:15-cis-phytoene synthase
MIAVVDARASLARHAKTFALAARLLPAKLRGEVAVVYAWCRRSDDAIDLVPATARPEALARLRAELAAIYQPAVPEDPLTAAFQQVVLRRRIPRQWPGDLIEGFAMDVERRRYPTEQALLLYCFRVAGTVGLMMARLMGVRDPAALRRAVDMGMAMQLTNICRDVAEDWHDGRLYLPLDLLGSGAAAGPNGPLAASAVQILLAKADQLYRSGDAGLGALPFRCAVAIRAARLAYGAIGGVIARRGFDLHARRAVVPRWRKAWLAVTAFFREVTVRAW